MTELKYPASCRRWSIFEIELEGPQDGNPFTDQWLQAIFTSANETVIVHGFYDGEGVYRIRFMPSFEEKYTFILRASFLDAPASGTFYAKAAEEGNHGPVHVADTYHFAYADGTRYLPIGTTCYVWNLQSEEQINKTLDTLASSSFNKVRFCIFPKHYAYNYNEPFSYPYTGTPVDSSSINDDNFMTYYNDFSGNHFDHHRFNPVHFQRIEYCLKELAARGIEADLILFHPYDRWGFSCMSREEDELYLNYVINRFSAFHNVWWAMANEWDLLKNKMSEDWEYLAGILVKRDPYHHLRSIHNCRHIYNQNAPWITHVSMQRIDLYKGAELTDQYRMQYGKPVINDEMGYEGNLPYGWGNLTGEELTRRAWETAMRGGYPGHSETFLTDTTSIWWSHGGTLQGESWKRFGFLKKILEEVPGQALAPANLEWDSVSAVPEQEEYNPIKSQYLFYYSFMRPSYRVFDFHNDASYDVEIIDTWNMTITPVGTFSGKFKIDLPGRMYMAIRLKLSDVQVQPKEEVTEQDVEQDIVDEGDGSEDEYAEISEVTAPEKSSETDLENEDLPDVSEEVDEAVEDQEKGKPEGGIVFDGNDLGETEVLPVQKPKPVEKEPPVERTLNIPPVDFSHSINEMPKKKR